MSLPEQGYPDWRRQADWSGALLVDVSGQSTPTVGETIYGRFFVGQWHALQLNFGPTSQAARLHVMWYSTETAVLPSYEADYHVSASRAVDWPTVNRDRWVELGVSGSVAGGFHYLRALPTNRQMQSYPHGLTGLAIYDSGALSLAASANTIVDAQYGYHGPAHLTCYGESGPVGVIVLSVNTAGASQRVTFVLSTGTSPITERIWLPPRRVQFQVINFHTATQNCRVHCMGDAF